MTVQPTPTTKEAVDKTSNGSQPESPVGQRSGKDGARPPLLKKVTTYTGTLTELASVEEEKERVRRASHDDPTIALPPPKPTTGLGATDVVLAVGVVGLSAAALLDFNASGSCNAPPADWYCDHVPPNWVMILLSLWSAALVLVGVGNVRTIVSEYFSTPRATDGVAWRVPLTDASFYDIGTANKFANSCQVREKGLKIVQYVLKGGAYAKVFPKPVGDAMKSLSKTTSIARRFFKFLRWIKHFEDLEEAREQKAPVMRFLLYFRIAANVRTRPRSRSGSR